MIKDILKFLFYVAMAIGFIIFALIITEKFSKSNTSLKKGAILYSRPDTLSEKTADAQNGISIRFEGVTSNKETYTINGKTFFEPWYLVREKLSNKSKKFARKGWVYGGHIYDEGNIIKPVFKPIEEKDLYNKQVDFTYCQAEFINGAEMFHPSDCHQKGDGMIRFYSNGRFIRFVGKETTTEAWTGQYMLENNILTLRTEPNYILCTFIGNKGTSEEKKLPRKRVSQYGVHNIEEKAIFINLPKYENEYMTWAKPFPNSNDDIFEDIIKSMGIKF